MTLKNQDFLQQCYYCEITESLGVVKYPAVSTSGSTWGNEAKASLETTTAPWNEQQQKLLKMMISHRHLQTSRNLFSGASC